MILKNQRTNQRSLFATWTQWAVFRPHILEKFGLVPDHSTVFLRKMKYKNAHLCEMWCTLNIPLGVNP